MKGDYLVLFEQTGNPTINVIVKSANRLGFVYSTGGMSKAQYKERMKAIIEAIAFVDIPNNYKSEVALTLIRARDKTIGLVEAQ